MRNLHRLPVLACLVLFLSLMPTAWAGSLFPPENIGSDPNVACPNGKVLAWSGDSVVCQDPTPGVSLKCPTGQILTEIKNGTPVCSGDYRLATNGYQMLPSGLIIEWGNFSLNMRIAEATIIKEGVGTDPGNQLVVYPKPFPHAIFSLVLTPKDVGGYCQETAWGYGIGLNGFIPALSYNSKGDGCAGAAIMSGTWMAVGY